MHAAKLITGPGIVVAVQLFCNQPSPIYLALVSKAIVPQGEALEVIALPDLATTRS